MIHSIKFKRGNELFFSFYHSIHRASVASTISCQHSLSSLSSSVTTYPNYLRSASSFLTIYESAIGWPLDLLPLILLANTFFSIKCIIFFRSFLFNIHHISIMVHVQVVWSMILPYLTIIILVLWVCFHWLYRSIHLFP